MPAAVRRSLFVTSLANRFKFLGVGEKTEALEPFHPDRIASRILGMGDVLSLIEDIESKVRPPRAGREISQQAEKRRRLSSQRFS